MSRPGIAVGSSSSQIEKTVIWNRYHRKKALLLLERLDVVSDAMQKPGTKEGMVAVAPTAKANCRRLDKE